MIEFQKHLRPIHPFPARMAPELVWEELPAKGCLRVLDPMAGSGTTLVTAKLRGHQAIGFDRDPLAVLISRGWLVPVQEDRLRTKAAEVLARAKVRAKRLLQRDAYPLQADDETRQFVRYWFDTTNRVQLTALADSISRVRDAALRDPLWCAFSRLIITKSIGASLAMDVSHSRPHRSYEVAPIRAFDRFLSAVEYILRNAPFPRLATSAPLASVELADARSLPLRNESVDVVITSPPYLNAIDYLRGHKLSLVWMQHSIKSIRHIRATNVGTEKVAPHIEDERTTEAVMEKMCRASTLSSRSLGMLRQYVRDMRQIIVEVKRVLCPSGKAVFVIGDCNIRNTFVKNSACIEALSIEAGLKIERVRSRPLPDNRRYLPPPASKHGSSELKKRMREEVIISVRK